MKGLILFICLCLFVVLKGRTQDVTASANKFIHTLDSNQKLKVLYPFDTEERYNFHFFPKDNRKGISFNELNHGQQEAAFGLLRTGLSENAINKTKVIRQLENVLKRLERRKDDDHTRDPGKYFITIFGVPGNNNKWGWRFEGHHISFTFSADNNRLVSGTPGFLGANPAVVQEGTMKGTQVLKEEAEMGLAFVNSLTKEQLKKAMPDSVAPNEIVTFVNRKAMIEHPSGIAYGELTENQKEKLLQLVRIYISRYTKLFADDMMKEIQQAGLTNLLFTWAGHLVGGIGHPNYYRIQGPSIIIEYDNSQNNANHVHTVIRDMKSDFGDILLQHYENEHKSASR